MNKKSINTATLWFVGLIAGTNLLFSGAIFYNPQIASFASGATFLIAENAVIFVLLGTIAFRHVYYRRSAGRVAADVSGIVHNNIYTDAQLVENIPSVLCIKDAKYRWLHADPTYLEFFNIGKIDYRGKSNAELSELPGTIYEALQFDARQDKKAWALGQAREDNETFKLSADHTVYDIVRIPLFDAQKQRLRLIIIGVPSTLKRQQNQSKIFPAVFFSSHLPFILLDGDFRIILVNNSFSALTGFSEQDALNKELFFLEKNSTSDFNINDIIQSFFRSNPGKLWSKELFCARKNGEEFPAKVHISELDVAHHGKGIPHFVANLFDITQEKLNERRIMQIAHFDDLTGLPNRVMFCHRLAEALSSAKRHRTSSVVLFLDLDRFKAVNDSLGHQAGDELLKEASKRLVRHVRKEDVVARLSGDEFAILLVNEKSHETAIYSATIVSEKIISGLLGSFYIQRQEVYIGVSIGIAIYPEDANNPEMLLKHADTAMYEAKKAGRNNFKFFHKNYIEKIKDKHQLELGLRNAMPKDELRLYYQPQYETTSRKLSGAEVLIRWSQGQSKMIPPDYFIPIAEEVGLIIPIGKWILETACEQQKKWLQQGYKIGQVAVNISARQFLDPKFVETVEEALAKTGLEAEYLELEITESMLIGDTRKIELQLDRLKKMGIKIALDDFGTGYSSLSYLKKFPIDVLKIDKSFIRELTLGSKDSQIACAIIEMGHSLGQKIVAEGVENEVQYNFLRQRKCDYIQGYYFSKPLPVNEMSRLLEETAS